MKTLFSPDHYRESDTELLTFENIHLIDKRIPITPEKILELFPTNKRIIVLDFAINPSEEDFKSGRASFLLHDDDSSVLGIVYCTEDGSRGIINIDHHHRHPFFDEHKISTTHQVLGYTGIGFRLDPEDIVVINHVDTDSTLSLLLLCNPDINPKMKLEMAHAALGADHTGDESMLANVIDSIYKQRDLELTLDLLKRYLRRLDLNDIDEATKMLVVNESIKRSRAESLLLGGEYQMLGNGVVLFCGDEMNDLQTIYFPPIIKKYLPNCTVIILANKKGEKFKFNVRSGPDMPNGMNLQLISQMQNLGRFGYNGRAHAGGNDRSLENAQFITPEDFGGLIAQALASK